MIYGYAGNDQIFGDAGNDVIWRRRRTMSLIAAMGDERVYGEAGTNKVSGGAGNDHVGGGG